MPYKSWKIYSGEGVVLRYEFLSRELQFKYLSLQADSVSCWCHERTQRREKETRGQRLRTRNRLRWVTNKVSKLYHKSFIVLQTGKAKPINRKPEETWEHYRQPSVKWKGCQWVHQSFGPSTSLFGWNTFPIPNWSWGSTLNYSLEKSKMITKQILT